LTSISPASVREAAFRAFAMSGGMLMEPVPTGFEPSSVCQRSKWCSMWRLRRKLSKKDLSTFFMMFSFGAAATGARGRRTPASISRPGSTLCEARQRAASLLE